MRLAKTIRFALAAMLRVIMEILFTYELTLKRRNR